MRHRPVLVGALAVALLAAPDLSSVATAVEESEVNISSLWVENVKVRSSECRWIEAGGTHDAPSSYVVFVYPQIWRGTSRRRGMSVRYGQNHDAAGILKGSWYYCPRKDRVGRFRAGPSEVNWYDRNSNERQTGAFDPTKTSFVIKRASRVGLSLARSADQVTARVTLEQYRIEADAFTAWTQHRVLVQRRTRGGSWKTISTLNTGTRGTARDQLSTPHRRTYRAVVLNTSRVWRGASPAQTK